MIGSHITGVSGTWLNTSNLVFLQLLSRGNSIYWAFKLEHVYNNLSIGFSLLLVIIIITKSRIILHLILVVHKNVFHFEWFSFFLLFFLFFCSASMCLIRLSLCFWAQTSGREILPLPTVRMWGFLFWVFMYNLITYFFGLRVRNDNGGAGDACGCGHPGSDCGQCSHKEALLDTQHLRRSPWQQQWDGDNQEPPALPGLSVPFCKCHLCPGAPKVGRRAGSKKTLSPPFWFGAVMCSLFRVFFF